MYKHFDPMAVAGARETWPPDIDTGERAKSLGVSAAAIERMLVDARIAAFGGWRPAASRRVLLGDPPRVQSARSAAGAIRCRAPATSTLWRRWHERRRIVHPDADDGHRDG